MASNLIGAHSVKSRLLGKNRSVKFAATFTIYCTYLMISECCSSFIAVQIKVTTHMQFQQLGRTAMTIKYVAQQLNLQTVVQGLDGQKIRMCILHLLHLKLAGGVPLLCFNQHRERVKNSGPGIPSYRKITVVLHHVRTPEIRPSRFKIFRFPVFEHCFWYQYLITDIGTSILTLVLVLIFDGLASTALKLVLYWQVCTIQVLLSPIGSLSVRLGCPEIGIFYQSGHWYCITISSLILTIMIK